ncbi:hypothetical protein D910_01560, partial [Dendroctonus ponderosae]
MPFLCIPQLRTVTSRCSSKSPMISTGIAWRSCWHDYKKTLRFPSTPRTRIFCRMEVSTFCSVRAALEKI